MEGADYLTLMDLQEIMEMMNFMFALFEVVVFNLALLAAE